MKTSADSFCNAFYLLLLLALALLSSCGGGGYAVAPGVVSPEGSGKQVNKPSESRADMQRLPSGFQEFKGEKKSITASWYGPDFHGKPTASGEIYNMHAFTCAHKDYPFGTKLKVTSTGSSKHVECIVNDRGPFVAGRDLDLSYASAKSIGLIGPGTQVVMIEPVGRDMRYVKYIKYGDARGGILTIQIGSFKESANAARLKAGLELHYKNVYITEATVGNEKHYRVRLGKFNGRDDAAVTGKTLANEGYNVLITKYEQKL